MRKIDEVIELKAKVFDMIRKLETLQAAAKYITTEKTTALERLQELEKKLVNRYARAKKLVNKQDIP
jgi:hypothetical protein